MRLFQCPHLLLRRPSVVTLTGMRSRRSVSSGPVVLMLVVSAAGSACGMPGPTPYPARTTAPLPPGAAAVELLTAPPGIPNKTGALDTCPGALLEPVTLRLDGTKLTFLTGEGVVRLVQWPRGFSARRNQGRVELVAPDGAVVAVEGDVVRDAIGGSGPAPGPFSVCHVGSETYGPAS